MQLWPIVSDTNGCGFKSSWHKYFVASCHISFRWLNVCCFCPHSSDWSFRLGWRKLGWVLFRRGLETTSGCGSKLLNPCLAVGPDRYSSDFTHSHLRILFAVSAMRHAHFAPSKSQCLGHSPRNIKVFFLVPRFQWPLNISMLYPDIVWYSRYNPLYSQWSRVCLFPHFNPCFPWKQATYSSIWGWSSNQPPYPHDVWISSWVHVTAISHFACVRWDIPTLRGKLRTWSTTLRWVLWRERLCSGRKRWSC